MTSAWSTWPTMPYTRASSSNRRGPRNFNHMVVALRDGGGWVYVDLTVPTAPWGAVVPPLQGQKGLMIRPDGEAEIVDFPLDPASGNRSSIVITGTLDADGTLTAEYEEIVTGTLQYRLRGEFDERLDERARLSVRQNLANRVGRGGVADSVEFFGGLDLEATPRLWASVTVEDLLQEIPGGWLLPVGLSTYGNPALIERLESEEDRIFPIDAAKVFGLREHHSEYRITLAEGWEADLPDDVVVEGPFGEYRSIYEQSGRELLVTRTIRGTDTILPPEDAPELLEWFRPLANDRVQTIVIRTPDAGE